MQPPSSSYTCAPDDQDLIVHTRDGSITVLAKPILQGAHFFKSAVRHNRSYEIDVRDVDMEIMRVILDYLQNPESILECPAERLEELERVASEYLIDSILIDVKWLKYAVLMQQAGHSESCIAYARKHEALLVTRRHHRSLWQRNETYTRYDQLTESPVQAYGPVIMDETRFDFYEQDAGTWENKLGAVQSVFGGFSPFNAGLIVLEYLGLGFKTVAEAALIFSHAEHSKRIHIELRALKDSQVLRDDAIALLIWLQHKARHWGFQDHYDPLAEFIPIEYTDKAWHDVDSWLSGGSSPPSSGRSLATKAYACTLSKHQF